MSPGRLILPGCFRGGGGVYKPDVYMLIDGLRLEMDGLRLVMD
jgi:hypothetical protein